MSFSGFFIRVSFSFSKGFFSLYWGKGDIVLKRLIEGSWSRSVGEADIEVIMYIFIYL